MNPIKVALTTLAVVFMLTACQPSQQPSQQADHKGAPKADIPSLAAGQGQVLPDFTVKDLDGQEHKLSQYRGKVMILDLFATWCPPCKMEIPHFVELQTAYAKDLAVVGLSFDQTGPEKVRAFAKEMNINYDIYWGNEDVARYVSLRGIPHTLVIDREGHVVKSFVGYRDKAVFEEAIKALF